MPTRAGYASKSTHRAGAEGAKDAHCQAHTTRTEFVISRSKPANDVVLGEMWWVAKMWYFAVPFSMTAKRALAIALGRHRKRSQLAAPPPHPGVRRSRIVNSASHLHRAEDHR